MSVNPWDLDTSSREDELEMELLEVQNDATKLARFYYENMPTNILTEDIEELIYKYLD